jgi:hypothetical protein
LGNQEGKRTLGTPRSRWKDNIKINLGETEWGVMDWIDVTQDREQWNAIVHAVINLRVP